MHVVLQNTNGFRVMTHILLLCDFICTQNWPVNDYNAIVMIKVQCNSRNLCGSCLILVLLVLSFCFPKFGLHCPMAINTKVLRGFTVQLIDNKHRLHWRQREEQMGELFTF